MISKNTSTENSVTFKSDLIMRRPELVPLAFELVQSKIRSANDQVTSQIRRDASMPTEQIQSLFRLATEGGMTQRQFESTAGRLRPNEASTAGSMGGRLWHHYMCSGSTARMSCLTFHEYLRAFHEAGWITFEQGGEFARFAFAVEMVAKVGNSKVLWQEQFVRDFLFKKFPGASKRKIGANLRKLRTLSETEDEYLELLIDLPCRINGLERLGTNLAQSALKRGEAQ